MADAPDLPASPATRRLALQRGLWLALAGGYALASLAGQRALAVAMVGLMAAALCWVAGQRSAALLIGLGLAGALVFAADSVVFLVYLPPLAAFSFMAWFFGRTLQAGIEPLITRVARQEHPELPAAIAHYTRTLTRLWAGGFLALLLLALVLMPLLPLDAWARWVQGLGYLLPAALFLGEYVYRRHRFSGMQHASIPVLVANTVRVIRQAAHGPAAPAHAPEQTRE